MPSFPMFWDGGGGINKQEFNKTTVLCVHIIKKNNIKCVAVEKNRDALKQAPRLQVHLFKNKKT